MAELCPQCGSLLPAGAPGQMCPQCLLGLGLGEAPAADHKASPPSRRTSGSAVSAVLTLPSTARGGRTATFALGSGPQISAETEELLRGRLQVGCWVIFVGLLLFVVRDLWGGTDDAFFLDRVVLLMFYGASGTLLRSHVRLALRQLRLFEAAIVWLVCAWFAYDRYYYTGVAIDDGDATGVLWAMTFSAMVYFAFWNAANMERFPRFKEALTNAGFHTVVVALQDDLVRDVRPMLYLLWGGVLFVLLIGCVNIANLVMVRSNVRVKELATRFALGAGRSRVTRQLLTESVVLASIGGGLGLLSGYWGLSLLEGLGIDQLPRASEIGMDTTVVVAALGLALGVGLLIGLIPVLSATGINMSSVFREEGRTGTSGKAARMARRSLVTAQVAIALILLIGAGLMLASFREVLSVDPGYNPANLLTEQVNLPAARYEGGADRRAFMSRAAGTNPRHPGRRRGRCDKPLAIGRQLQRFGHPRRRLRHEPRRIVDRARAGARHTGVLRGDGDSVAEWAAVRPHRHRRRIAFGDR